LKIFRDKYFVTAGAIKDSTYDSAYPRGCLLVIDKADISTVLSTSIKTYRTYPSYAWLIKFWDFDVSEDSAVVLSLISIGETTGAAGMVYGMMGDGHHNKVYKHAISETTGALT